RPTPGNGSTGTRTPRVRRDKGLWDNPHAHRPVCRMAGDRVAPQVCTWSFHPYRQGSSDMQTRRAAMLSAIAALAVSAVPARAAAGEPRPAGLVRLRLPAPSGPYPVGTVTLRLVDASRTDPWVASQPYRELMISIRYPARTVGGYPAAPQMLPGEAAGFAALNSFTDVPSSRVDWARTRTHAHEGAPADRDGGPFPVVCYSPGAGGPRS